MPMSLCAIDTITPAKALGLGALLSGVNPKNLALCLTGGATLGSDGPSSGESVVKGPLDELRQWRLTLHNAAVMSVLLLVIGVAIMGKGLAGF